MYKKFAYIYDKLMQDIDYDGWTERIAEAIKKENPKAVNGLDLACGSGNFSLRLKNNGFKMTGADVSEEMLAVASVKPECKGIDFIRQDIRSLNVLKRFDFITILCDGINYILDGLDFNRVATSLNDGGVLVFDISTEQRLKTDLGNNLFFHDGEKIMYVCSNSFDKKRKLLQMDLTFLAEKNESGLYEKFTETHILRAYDIGEIERLLSPYFSYSCEDFELRHDKKGRRLHFICKKL